MPHPANEPTNPAATDAGAVRKPYQPPTVRSYGSVRDLTLAQPAGPNFDGGGGANIYAS